MPDTIKEETWGIYISWAKDILDRAIGVFDEARRCAGVDGLPTKRGLPVDKVFCASNREDVICATEDRLRILVPGALLSVRAVAGGKIAVTITMETQAAKGENENA